MSIFLIVLGLVSLIALVVVHEWGHFKAARRSGVDVEEFGIGFPPRLWSKKLGDKSNSFDFSINLLPLGGFVKLKGEHDIDNRKGSFGAASMKTKIKIMTAGVFMNLLVAFGLLGLGSIIGLPQILPNQFNLPFDSSIVRHDVLVAVVEDDSPAEEAGLKPQDKLIILESPNERLVVEERSNAITQFTQNNAGQEIDITYQRAGGTIVTSTVLRTEAEVEASRLADEAIGHLGIQTGDYVVKRSTWSAPITALGTLGQFTFETVRGIGVALSNLFFGDRSVASEQVTGPIGIFVILRDGSILGIEFIVLLVAIISLTLAIINLLPIPALDGGRLFISLLFRALKKPLTPDLEDKIHGSGFLLLMLLIVLITIVDIQRFF